MRTRRFVVMLMTLALIFLFSGMLVSWQDGFDYRRPGEPHDTEAFDVFWEAWDGLQRLFWSAEKLDHQQMTYGAARGMLASLGDPYSAFLDTAQHHSDSDRLQGEFEGIGVELALQNDSIVVNLVYPDSPAEAAGVLHGDIVISANGITTAGMLADQVQALTRGPVGTSVAIELKRDPGRLVTLRMERQRIEVPSLAWKLLGPAIGYVHIYSFTDRTPEELAQALSDMTDSDVEAMILDLRGNGGGVVEAAVAVLGQLLGKGIAYRELARDVTETRYPVPFNSHAVAWPLAVLVDTGTASSAEIVAAAIRDHERGTLYGQTTFGKGSVQAVFELDDGSSVHLTVARWLSADGHAIDGIGLPPDVALETTSGQQEDVVLQTAMSDLKSGLAQSTTSTPCEVLCKRDGVRET